MTSNADIQDLVVSLREASRLVVRELGLLETSLAPESITVTQCHAMLELERDNALTVGETAKRLNIDKSSMSRAAANLVERSLVKTRSTSTDRRQKRLSLTAAGRRMVEQIHQAANARVGDALMQLGPPQQRAVLEGMATYGRALHRARTQARIKIRPIARADDLALATVLVRVMEEFGAVGPGFAINDTEVRAMSRHYRRTAKPPAEYYVLEDEGTIVGGGGLAALHGADKHTCELRKMYLLPGFRGTGLGRKLLVHLLARARARGYRRCYLETMATMQRAQSLYRSVGFEAQAKPQGDTGHFGCNAWYALDLT